MKANPSWAEYRAARSYLNRMIVQGFRRDVEEMWWENELRYWKTVNWGPTLAFERRWPRPVPYCINDFQYDYKVMRWINVLSGVVIDDDYMPDELIPDEIHYTDI